MLIEDQSEIRKKRHHITQEDFTPVSICQIMCDEYSELFSDFSKTFCDIACGIGNILRYILQKRFEYCNSAEDIYKAIETLYGTELMDDNTKECKEKILSDINEIAISKNWDISKDIVLKILNNNIVCTDTFTWDYENWAPQKYIKTIPLF
jgi:type I restriction-modification system DNA methylase subunit